MWCLLCFIVNFAHGKEMQSAMMLWIQTHIASIKPTWNLVSVVLHEEIHPWQRYAPVVHFNHGLRGPSADAGSVETIGGCRALTARKVSLAIAASADAWPIQSRATSADA